MSTATATAPDTDAYYVNLFVENPEWSAPAPNHDEAARWTRISGLLQTIAAQFPGRRLRILDVGCGRGWLTNLASRFGNCEGVEPVAPVVAQAKRLFPNLNFTAGTADAILDSPDFQPYDLVITSEVIEHVPRAEQPDFARKLARLLKPGGHVILTTPRGESLQEWTRLSGDPSQPVEDWLREPELRELFIRAHFAVIGHQRVLFDLEARRFVAGESALAANQLVAIYQVWAFQLCTSAAQTPLAPLDNQASLVARAVGLLAAEDLEDARRLLVWTVALHADNAPARKLFAEVLQRLGHDRAAEAHAERAAELDPENAPAAGNKSFSFLNHLREGALLEGAPGQLEVRNATISDRTAPCIYLHPPAKLRFEVPHGVAGRFTCALGIQPEAWDKSTSGGVEFSLKIDGREVFRKAINPRQNPADRCWHEVEVEVPAVSGRNHEFIFRTQVVGSPADFRWALWREPVFRPHAAT